MDAQAPVLCRQLGVVGAPGAAGVRKHEDALDIVHERPGLSEIGGSRTVFDDQSGDAV